MTTTRLATLLCLAAACGGKPGSTGTASDAAPGPTVGVGADAGAGAATAPTAPEKKARPAPPSKDARKTYRKQLAAGRKLAAEKKWGEAVVAFDKALAAIPHDGRALSELSWAAFNAGDYARARKAGSESVAATADKKVKAASLYNLGRVEEADGQKARAAALYGESLALRPNKTVKERLAGLGQDAAAVAEAAPLCATPVAEAALCKCIDDAAETVLEEQDFGRAACTLDADGGSGLPEGLRIARATTDMTETYWLVARQPGGWAVVAELADVYNPGAFGIFEEFEITSVKRETLGDKRIVKILGHHARQDSDAGIMEIESVDSTVLTVCVLGDEATPTRCPLTVPIAHSYVRDRLDFGDEEELDPEIKAMQTPGLPVRDTSQLKVDLLPNGTAEIVLVKGSSSGFEGVLGTKKLW